MLGDFDILAAAGEITSSEHVHQVDSLAMENGTIEIFDANLQVNGDMMPGGVVKGSRSVLVKGTLQGNERWPCHIEVDGDIVIMGDVSCAQLMGRSIFIGGQVKDCQLSGQLGIEVGGNLSQARIAVGEFDQERRQILVIVDTLSKVGARRDYAGRQLRLDQKRVDRMFNTTRVDFAFSLGNVIRRKRRRIEVDLRPFYDVVQTRTEAEIDQAIVEFFAKGVVGALTRTNQNFLRSNRNRQKILMEVIRNLHELFLLTRGFDKMTKQVAGLESDLNDLIEGVNGRKTGVYVKGAMRPDVDIRFVIPTVSREEDGEVALEADTAHLQMRNGEDGLDVKRVDSSGEEEDVSCEPGAFECVTVHVHEGLVVWDGVVSSRQVSA